MAGSRVARRSCAASDAELASRSSARGSATVSRPCSAVVCLSAFVFALAAIGGAQAQGAAPTPKPLAKSAPSAIAYEALVGTWVRPDGGYRIEIKDATSLGQLDAMYFNPRPLPFAKAQVRQDGSLLRLSFELQAGGYNGSTYELTYDAASDQLKGTYYQAVMKQKFEVAFARRK